MKSADLSEEHEQLAKATGSDLKYDLIKDQLKRIFGDLSAILTAGFSDNVKTENVNQTEHEHGVLAVEGYSRSREQYSYQPRGQSSNGAVSTSVTTSARRGRNPSDGQGNPTKCSTCKSVNHWAQDCPDKVKDEHDKYYSYHVVLFQSDFDHPSKLQSSAAESWNAAILDCGASKTVCGQAWFDTYIETLSNEDKSNTTYDKSNSIYRFGDGKTIPALKNARIPALIGSQKVMIDTDIVSNQVPLLLLRESMKTANMHLNFQDDTVSALGQTLDVIVTKSGH